MNNDIVSQEEIQEGFVVNLDGEFAKVRIAPNASCDNCNTCGVVHMELLAYNPLKAFPGQKVRFTMVQDNMIKIAFMIFVLPLISIFAGLYAGSLLASFLSLNETALMTAGAFVFLAVSIVIIFNYDKNYKLNKSNFPQIIEVIN